jgi:hypothetical protein
MEQPKTRTRRQMLLSFHNQRSQIDLGVKGLYGPRAQLVENLHRLQRSTLPPLEDPSCDHHLYWTSPPEIVLVVKKIRDLEVTQKFKTIITFLVKTLELKVVVEPTVLSEELIREDSDFPVKELQTWNQSNRDVVLSRVDFILCIGGDGTILYTASLFQEAIPPMMSFHVGSLGFLTHFVYENYQQDIRRVIEGNVLLKSICVHLTLGKTAVTPLYYGQNRIFKVQRARERA